MFDANMTLTPTPTPTPTVAEASIWEQIQASLAHWVEIDLTSIIIALCLIVASTFIYFIVLGILKIFASLLERINPILTDGIRFFLFPPIAKIGKLILWSIAINVLNLNKPGDVLGSVLHRAIVVWLYWILAQIGAGIIRIAGFALVQYMIHEEEAKKSDLEGLPKEEIAKLHRMEAKRMRAEGLGESSPNQVVPLGVTVAICIWRFICLTFVAAEFNVDITALVTGMGISGVVVAFAAQDSVSNIFGGVVIILDKPFKKGDCITVKDITGVVCQIKLRATLLRTANRSMVYIPNSVFVTNPVHNAARGDYTPVVFEWTVPISTTTEQIRQFGAELMNFCDLNPSVAENGVSNSLDLLSFSHGGYKLRATIYYKEGGRHLYATIPPDGEVAKRTGEFTGELANYILCLLKHHGMDVATPCKVHLGTKPPETVKAEYVDGAILEQVSTYVPQGFPDELRADWDEARDLKQQLKRRSKGARPEGPDAPRAQTVRAGKDVEIQFEVTE